MAVFCVNAFEMSDEEEREETTQGAGGDDVQFQ